MSERVSVLYVGDSAFTSAAVETLLDAGEGVTVDAVSSIADGIDRLDEETFSCIISEYHLPDGIGTEIVRRARERIHDVPFVLVVDEPLSDVSTDVVRTQLTDVFSLEELSAEVLAERAIELGHKFRQRRLVEALESVEHEIDRMLVRATTREEIERRACEIFSEAEPYLFAWTGHRDSETGRIVPQASAGVGHDYLETIVVTTGAEATAEGPAGRAYVTGEPQVIQNILEGTAFEPWREQALERGFRSVASIPLDFGDDVYGVLNVYADRTSAFEEDEMALLEEIGSSIAFAIHSLELRKNLERNRNRLQAILEATPDVICIFTADGTCHEIIEGSEELGGEIHERILGRTVDDVFESDVADRFRDAIERTLETMTVQQVEYTLSTDDGDASFEGRMAPLGEEADEVVFIARDVTQRQGYERRLRQQRDQLEVLNRLVRHDIRNDMTVVLGLGEMVRGEIPADVQPDFNRIIERARRVVTLTQTARDLVEMIRGEGSIDVKPVSLVGALTDEIENAQQGFPRAQIDVVSDLPSVQVKANELLSAVFRNILTNAVEHNDKETPRVEVSVERGDGVVRISIADNGPGIPDRLKSKLFERQETELSEEASMGLFLVHTLVSEYGGRVRVEDNDPEGSTFVVELKLAES